jgi:hypothetical protein
MQMVGTGDQNRRHCRIAQQRLKRVMRSRARGQSRRRGAHRRIGLENGGDMRRLAQKCDIAQMLLPHHPASDDAVTNARAAHALPHFKRDTYCTRAGSNQLRETSAVALSCAHDRRTTCGNSAPG